MATPKTVEELQAELDARKREDDAAAEAEKQRRQAGLFDWVKNFFGGFNFGSILMWGMMLTGIYFLAKSKIGQELIEKLVGNFKPETQATILGFLDTIGIGVDMTAALDKMPFDALKKKLTDAKVPEPILAVVAKDPGTWSTFFATVKEANTDAKGKPHVTLSSFTNDKTIFTLMTKQPEMALALASAAKNLPASADGKPSDTAKQIAASIKAIVNSERLDVLLSPAHRENTLRIFTAALPAGLPIRTDSLAAIIAKGVDANGKATDDLRKLLNAAIDGDASTALATTMQGMKMSEIVAIVDAKKIPDPVQKSVIQQIQKTPAAQAALDALSAALGKEQSAQLAAAVQGADGSKAAIRLLLKPENIHALPQMIALVNQVPALRAQFPYKLETLSNLIDRTGVTADRQPNAALTTLLSAVSQAPTLTATDVMPAVTNYILNPTVANNRQAAPAVRALLASVDTSKLSKVELAQLQDFQTMLSPQGLIAMSNIKANGVDPVKLGAAFTVTGADGHSQPSGIKIAQNLLSADARAVIRKAGIANLAVMTTQMSPVLTQYNLAKLLKLGDDIDRIDANKTPANRARNLDVIGAFANLTQPGIKPADAFKNVDEKELAGFFAVQGNKNAVYTLLHNLKSDAMPPQQRELIAYLVKHPDIFGAVDDTKSATVMLGLIKGDNGGFAKLIADWNLGKELALQTQGLTVTESQIVVGLGNLLKNNVPPAPTR
jgi:hypothetical protein